ncbi:hypothetical protein PMIN05_009627 [Paraphaeosphaeria minitans]
MLFVPHSVIRSLLSVSLPEKQFTYVLHITPTSTTHTNTATSQHSQTEQKPLRPLDDFQIDPSIHPSNLGNRMRKNKKIRERPSPRLADQQQTSSHHRTAPRTSAHLARPT